MWEIINVSKVRGNPSLISAQVIKEGARTGDKCIDILAAEPELLEELVQNANLGLESRK